MKIFPERIKKCLQKHDLRLILLHGSWAKGKTHPQSDVDIAVVRKDRQKNYNLLALIKDLSVALQTERVDLSDLTLADPLFLFAALQKSQLLAGKKGDYEKLLKRAFFRYNDYLPFLAREENFVKERIAHYVAA
ncbi:nucleotidyltransferase domain-containing protein [Patescibacteria group bacterium]